MIVSCRNCKVLTAQAGVGRWPGPRHAPCSNDMRKIEVLMQGTKLVGVVLLVLGILAVAYGGFSYTKDTDKVNIGPIHIEVQDKERVNVPLWAGVLVAIAGGVILARKG